jgi:hypothetical protein
VLKEALQKVITTLDELRVPYALIGGLAVIARGVMRATKDVDLLVDWSLLEAGSLAQALNENRLPATFRKGAPDDPLVGLIRIAIPSGAAPTKVDILFPSASWQREAVRKAAPLDLEGFAVRVVQAADLFLLKLHAGGPMDFFDAARLLELQTADERRAWKARAASLGKSKAFAECLKFLRKNG